MRKIPTLFVRDANTRLVVPLFTDGSKSILETGTPTRKWDGTSCKVEEGELFKRYTFKPGGGAKAPSLFKPAQPSPEANGSWPGWVPVDRFAPEDHLHRKAWGRYGGYLPDGTYELLGPGVNSNHEGLPINILMPHGKALYVIENRTYEGLKLFLTEHLIEGLVFYHKDGCMAKIKRTDFGLAWPLRGAEK